MFYIPVVISYSGTVCPFNDTVKSTHSSAFTPEKRVQVSVGGYYLGCSFLGVPCFLVCHR